jgi:hypothetical protein
METLFTFRVVRIGGDAAPIPHPGAPRRRPIRWWTSDAVRGRSTTEQCVTEFAANLTGNFAIPLAARKDLVRDPPDDAAECSFSPSFSPSFDPRDAHRLRS